MQESTGKTRGKMGLVRRGYSATGGAEAYLKRFVSVLKADGRQSILFTGNEWPTDDWPGEQLISLSGKSPRTFADALQAARAKCDYLFSLERVWSCDCYRAGDGVHQAWLDRRKAIEPAWKGWTRSLHRLNPLAGKHRELVELEGSLFSPDAGDGRGAGIVIANCQMVKDEIVRYYGYPAERIHVIYNGLPQSSVKSGLRDEARKRLGLSEFDYVVLFAGSGWERKGLRFAIEAIRRVKLSESLHPLLLVAGRGNASSYPGSDRVRFLGPVKEMDALYAAADAFILPTIYDPFSNACLEAAGAGLPVITTRANGFSEIIEPGVNGEVVESAADIEGLARAIEKWSDAERRKVIKPGLIALAAKFTIEENVRLTLEAIQKGI